MAKKVKGKKKQKALAKELVQAAAKNEELAAYIETVADEQLIANTDFAAEMPTDDAILELSDMYKSFADPTRLKILFLLAGGDKCVAEISEGAGVSQSATSHQLRGLKQFGMVNFTRNGKQVIYSLADEGIKVILAQGLACIEQ